jgi:hypothetical protein
MITITEGLQEIKTIVKRIEKKREFVNGYLWRNSQIRDPHEKNGGSYELIKKERQAIKDLEDNIISIRCGISKANEQTNITVCNETRTIAEWLIWRREIAAPRKSFLESMYSRVQSARTQAVQKGMSIVDRETSVGDAELVINVDEKRLADEVEKVTEILSALDGQLSLKNSTVKI